MIDVGLASAQYFLKPGYAVANRDDMLVRTVLGNSVAVTLFDAARRWGGICHFVLPRPPRREAATSQYGTAAVIALHRMLRDFAGGENARLCGQIIGGAQNHRVPDDDLGRQNVDAARESLRWLGVPVVSEDIGGQRGRKIIYHTGSDELGVFKVDTLRDSDWFLPSTDLRFAEEPRRRAHARGA